MPKTSKMPKGYEASDIQVKAIGGIAIFLVFSATVVFLVLGWVVHELKGHDSQPATFTSVSALRLQTTELGAYQSYRERELKLLKSYQWKDQTKSRAQIPIERAMEIYVNP